jgi:predicted phage tail protein
MSSGGRIAGGPLIAGAGGSGGKGGGSSARTPTTARDSLDSTQYAQLIDLISEGEIDGLVNGLQSIYLDDTPIQNPDGSFNFQNVEVYLRNGTQNQEVIPFAGAIEDERSVGVTVRNDGPVTRRITDAQTEAARITITVPRLERITNEGDTVGESVRLQISVQYNGGGFNVVIDDTISGRTGDVYQRDYLVSLTGAFPVDIRLTRITPDSTDLRLANEFSWSSYTEIIYAKLNYANSALVGLRIDAQQFSSIPRRAYDIRGIKVRIPSNATVDQVNGRLIYSGVWNGTFGAAQWCSDPAWVLWDLLTSRYGFGDQIDPASLDRWAFFSASQYCSQSVPNGFGGWEPRFSCNVNIQTSEDAYKLINDMCSVFRAMPYWAAGALTVSQDKPSDPVFQFTNANVDGGVFTYSNSSLKTRFNVAVVSYFDISTRDIAYEVVEDAESIAKYGVLKTEVSAFATSSRGQAHRLGRWLVYTGGETVTFTTGPDAGVVVRPGTVVSIADQLKAGSRRGGRIAAATTTVITVDDAAALPGSGGVLSVVLPTGAVEARPVASRAGAAVRVSPGFSVAPNVNSVWLVETTSIQSSLWRVLAVGEEDGIRYKVTALEYDPSKYDFIELGTALVPRDITDLNVTPAAPNNLTAQEVIYDAGGRAESKLLISWQPVNGVSQYRIRWRERSGNWTVANIEREDYEIQSAPPGVYQVEVYSIGANLRASVEPARLTTQAFGKTAPPEDVTGLSLLPGDQLNGVLSWNRATALDVLLGGKVLIRHNVSTDGTATWETSQELVASAAGSQTQKQVPMLEGSYLVKFEDDTGNRSANATLVVADLPTPQPRELVHEYAEDQETPPFSGNVTGMYYSVEYDGLVIEGGQLIDDMAPDGDFDALISIDGVGGISPVGEYEFGSTWNMGGVFDVNMRRRLVTFPLLVGLTWDDKTIDIDDWPEIDEGNLDGTNALVFVRATMDDPSGTPTWGDWQELTNGIVRGWGFQFKAWATTNNPSLNIVLSELGCVLELQQRVEQSATLTSGAGLYAATFADAFYQTPNMGITAMNMATGDYFEISAVTRSGFSIVFKNSAGTAVSRQFTYTGIGYGRQV